MKTLLSLSSSSKIAGLFAALLLCFCCALPAARATEWVISPTGSTSLSLTNPSGIQNGDTVTLFMSATTGGPATNANLALITINNGDIRSFTIQSGDGNWYNLTNARNNTSPGTATRAMTLQAGVSTLTLVNVGLVSNHATGNGGAIVFNAPTNAQPPQALTTITGTAIFRDNGSLTAGLLGGAIQDNAGQLKISGSFIFDGNVGDRGGAINMAANTLNLWIEGDNLFQSNTAWTSNGGAVCMWGNSTGTAFFSGDTRFIGNYAGNLGGAINILAGTGNYLSISSDGTTLFDGNKAGVSGGAISASGNGAYIGGNTTFINNISGSSGGAIYAPASGATITLDATGGDILFRGNLANTGTDFSQPGNPNAIALFSGSLAGGGQTSLILDTGDSPAGNTITFYDPIATSDTTNAYDADQVYANVTVTGNGTVLFDAANGPNQSAMTTGTTTLATGTMLLANGAIYGAGTAATGEVLYLQAPAVLAATNGAIMADTIAYDPGAQINVSAGGTLGLYTSEFVGAGLRITGNGTIDAGGNTITASLVSPGSIVSGTPGVPVGPNTPQTLTFAPGTILNIEDGGTLAFDLFANNASDLLAADILTLSGSACITPIGDTAGHYELITATNDLSAFDFFTQVGGATLSFEAGGTQLWLDLTVNNSAIRWTGLGGGLWASTLSSNFNWDDGAGGYSFINGDSVSFDDTATGTRTVTIDPAGVAPADITVNNSAGNDYTIAGAGGITTGATGKLTKTGSGALNFANTAANTFTAGIELSGGTIGFTNAAQLGDGGNGIHVTADAALRANAATATLANDLNVNPATTLTLDTGAGGTSTLTYTGTLHLDTTSTLAKTGAGILSIASDNSANTATTLVSQGILSLDGPTGNLGGAIDIAAGATLAGSGAATGAVNAAPGAIIYPGATTSATAPVTLNINNLNLNSSILNFNLFATGTNDRINIAGTLNPGAGTNTINISTFQSGTYNLGNLSTLLGGSCTITIGGIAPAVGARQVASLVAGGPGNNDLLLETVADISRILTWTGATSGTWTPNDANWTDHASVTLFAGGDRVTFDGAADAANTANRAITIAGAGVNVSDMIVQGAANYTFTGAGITADPASVVSGSVIATADATGKLTKAGSGTLALQNAANNFTGGIELDAGALTFTDPAQLGDGGNGITLGGDATLANASGASQTLANNITVATGVTGTLDTAANTLTLAGTLNSELGTLNTSTAPAGALAAATADAPATLAKIGAGSLTLTAGSADANLAIAIDEGSLLLNGGTVSVANLQFAASTTLAGAGALAGATTLNGQVTAAIASGAVATLSSTITGAGGFLKTNTGELQLAGPAALGYTGPTQIDQGTLRLTGFTGTTGDAATITQAITLNGGTLALGAGAAAPAEATANDWTGLNIIQGAAAATSAIAGVNDIIHVGSGAFAPALQSGLIVAIDAGAGNTAVLGNAANNFSGIVRIDSGTLQVTSTTGLGAFSANNVKAVLNGGALQISATLPTNSRIEARADGIIAVDDGIYTQWQQITNPTAATAAITKAGSGTLCINANFQASSLTVAEGRYIANGNGSVAMPQNSGAITVLAGAVFQSNGTGATLTTATLGLYGAGQSYVATTNGTISNSFTGAGTLEVTAGNLVLTSPNTDISNIAITGAATAVAINGGNLPVVNFGARNSSITVDQAALVLASSTQNLGNVTLANGATLAFLMPTGTIGTPPNTTVGPLASAFKTATLASLAVSGTGTPALWFNSNLATGRSDHLTINAPVSGTYGIGVQNYGALAAQFHGTLDLITAPGASDATFTPITPTIESGLYSYTLNTTTSAGGVSVALTGTGAMASAPALINNIAASLPLSWFSELDSVNQRMGELHFENRDTQQGGLAAWVRGYGEKLNFNTKLTGRPFDETHYAGEAGVDYKVGGAANNVYLGAYAGYGSAQRDFSTPGDAGSDSAFGGLYATIAAQTGWYLDLAGKFNNFKTSLTAVSPTGESATADYRNWAIGGSLELGKRCDIGNGLYVEPQIQSAITAISGVTYQTSAGMTVQQLPATAWRARGGLLLGYDIETDTHGTLSVYLKGYYGNQWVYDGQMNISTAAGQSGRYSPVITGEYLEGGAGLAWRFTKATQVYIDYSTTQAAQYIKPWAFNLGIRHLW